MKETGDDREFEALLNYLKQTRGFDFTGYKRTSLRRRINRRMQALGIERYPEYIDELEVHPQEFTLLFNTILINVTSFFRDPAAWEYVADEIIPGIVAEKEPFEPIRVWSAGCASGEEPYSVAMFLAESLGEEGFRQRVKIYATDVDEEALQQARQAVYTAQQIEDVPTGWREKYFEPSHDHFVFDKELRRSVIFGRHDLVQDAPISRVDLLICRNTLMYFNAETQAKILARFHFALNDGGYLFLGKAEMLLTHANLFVPVDLKRRVFTKVPKPNLRDRLLVFAQAGTEPIANHLVKQVRLREAAFDASPMAQIVVDANGFLAQANDRARALFTLAPADLGRPLQELELPYRLVELRSAIERSTAERRPVILKEARWPTTSGDSRALEVHTVPLVDMTSTLLGTSITFIDVSDHSELQQQLLDANQELETAFEELQSTHEELETTNEELQSTVEELETTNEELQSTNEELETMNEELQSTNEELQTINDELRERTRALNEVNAFLEEILSSLQSGVVVLDREMRVEIWNKQSEELWGLRAEEVEGQFFLNLDIGLPVEKLRQPIRSCLAAESEYELLTLDAINRRGRPIQVEVRCTRLHSRDKQVRGAIVLMAEEENRKTS